MTPLKGVSKMHFDFRPAIMGTRFYRYGRGLPEDENVTSIELKGKDDIFELGFELILGGLDFIKLPKDYLDVMQKSSSNIINPYQPFYLNFIFYFQRGMKDSVLINHYSIYIDEEMLKEGVITISYTITKFRNDLTNSEEERLFSDFVSNIFQLSVSMSDKEVRLDSDDEFVSYAFDSYNTLFKTKIPYVNEGEYYGEK